MWLRLILATSCLSLLNCGPYLREVRTGEVQRFETSDGCAQGPLRLETRLEGSRWGEFVRLTIRSPNALVGRMRVLVDDKEVLRGPWRTGVDVAEKDGTRWVADKAPANLRCVERPPSAVETVLAETSAPAVSVGGAEDTWASLPAGQAQVEQGAERQVLAGATAEVQATGAQLIATRDGVDFVETGRTTCGAHRGDILLLAQKDERRDGDAPFKPGSRVVVEIWSEAPNDYAGACFLAERGTYQPSGTDAEWFAELDKREADRIREAHEREADRLRRAHVREVEFRRENERLNREEQARVAFCRAHPNDVDCRVRVFARVTRPRPAPPPRVVTTPPPAVATTPPPPQPHPPSGPPPEPRQGRPTQPVDWAQWIPGYWQWTGFEWVWLDGWWKVDEVKLARANAAATQPCPAPRVETPPPRPVASAQWHAGAWLWAGLAWVWLPGQWRGEVHAARPVAVKK